MHVWYRSDLRLQKLPCWKPSLNSIFMKILPANSEGCWIFIVVIFLSFGFVMFFSFLFCGVIFLAFSCRFLIQRGWLDPEPSCKVQKRNFTSTRVICLSFFVVSLSFFVVFCHPLRFPDWESFLKDFCAFSRSQNDNKVTKKNTTKWHQNDKIDICDFPVFAGPRFF